MNGFELTVSNLYYSRLNLTKQPRIWRIILEDVDYRSDTVNLKSFIGKVFLRIKWKLELHHEAILMSFDVWSNHKQIWKKISN